MTQLIVMTIDNTKRVSDEQEEEKEGFDNKNDE